MTTWLTSTRKRSSKRNSTSVIGFGPKNGVQATSSSSRGDSSSPSSSRKHFQCSVEALHPPVLTNPCWYQEFQTFSHFEWLTINAKTHKENLEPQTCKYLKSNHDFSEVHANCHLHNTQKDISFANSQTSCWDLCSKAMPTLLHNPLDCHLWQRVIPTTKCLTKSWLV